MTSVDTLKLDIGGDDHLLALIWPPDGGRAADAKGVVFFLHGFSQGPEAYYETLLRLSKAGLFVLAPEFGVDSDRGRLQTRYRTWSALWLQTLVQNRLDGHRLPDRALNNIGLLGHSLGGGMATVVAADASRAGHPFKAVAVEAPQISLIALADAMPDEVLKNWPVAGGPRAPWSIQYGREDTLAPPQDAVGLALSIALATQTNTLVSLNKEDVKSYTKGTHLGFADQLVLGQIGVVPEILVPLLRWEIPRAAWAVLLAPIVNGLWWLKDEVPWRAVLGTGSTQRVPRAGDQAYATFAWPRYVGNTGASGELPAVDPVMKTADLPPATPGDKRPVFLTDLGQELVAYTALLIFVAGAGVLLTGKPLWKAATDGTFARGDAPIWPVLLALVFAYITVQGLISLGQLQWVENHQRKPSRARLEEFFKKTLIDE